MGLTGLRPGSAHEESSKSDRKFNKKIQFYAKVKDTVSSLSAKKAVSKKKKLRSRQKKLKAYDLSSLSEFLPKLKAPQQPQHEAVTSLKLNSKSMVKLIEREGKQLMAVLNHPAFQADPLAAIHQYLERAQPVPAEKPEKRQSKTRKKAKSKKLKAPSGAQSMDI